MTQPRDLILVFGTVQRVMRAESHAKERGLDVDVIPAPRSVSSECGVVLEAHSHEAPRLKEVLDELDLEPRFVYRHNGDAWVLTQLEAAPQPDVQLTRQTAYGGCGAKLAKGILATILCGLPRLESDDLIVGIEFADDAGVVRLRDDLALIHSADFFPPMIDDPYSFGRIAAVNALSDIYAMGGQPLAGMNLVSFPLGLYDKGTLKEILRGGLSALEEAGAVLAGGHTVEGQELLYGMAVTGTIDPRRLWKNGGARSGDWLVLTKPLGTGVITTASKAELADAAHLTAAIRWMATLNRGGAEAIAKLHPHAVTDVTGFGLAGHAAEMAEASDATIRLDASRLPLLPGSYDSAAMGLVPAGTGKNRESLGAMFKTEDGLDPILADLALDPQTSGGLLAALEPAEAVQLVRWLPDAAIVGTVIEGESGRVELVGRIAELNDDVPA